MTRLEDIDTAAVAPCPNCGTPTRRMGSVPIAGAGLDLTFTKAWWCSSCLRAKCKAAADAVRARAQAAIDVTPISGTLR